MKLDRKLLAKLADTFTTDSFRRGIEKEAIRTDKLGQISQAPHPVALGSALSHPQITTDFSEAQLEFVTGTSSSVADCLLELDDIHRYVYGVLEGEVLWPASMPCMLPVEKQIPIATFGTSNEGLIKNIYRRGLANRYGRYMQTISGLHYNFSIADYLWLAHADALGVEDKKHHRNRSYLDLIKNFRRNSWLLIYLFGASPAMCGSFISTLDHGLEKMDEESYYLPYATSLRMGPLGYQSAAQAKIDVRFNSINDYVNGLAQALSEPHSEYEEIGLKDADGKYLQLSTALLQIEAEFYGPIRPKPKPQSGIRPLASLYANGIEYIEVRCLDLNPFERTGINSETVHFLDAFLVYCWLAESYRDSDVASKEIQENQLKTVRRGRDPEVKLRRGGSEIHLNSWARELLDEVAEVAAALDSGMNTDVHMQSVNRQRAKMEDQSLTPSSQILSQMRSSGLSYYRFVKSLSERHQAEYVENALAKEKQELFESLAASSLRKQEKTEANQQRSFDDYLADYMKLEMIGK